jgi:putative transposase
VIQRGINRSAIFTLPGDYHLYRTCLGEACERHHCRIHAYVLMGNHVHLLMTPECEVGISKVMQSVGRRYVRYFNTVRQRTGTLWEGRFRATAIDTERHLLTCYRYIELNPVRAGLVKDPAEYRWSSYGANAYGRSDSLVTPHARYLALAATSTDRRSVYRHLFEQVLDADTLLGVRTATHYAWPLLGSDSDPHSDPHSDPIKAPPTIGAAGARPGSP